MRTLLFTFVLLLPIWLGGCSTVKEAAAPPQNKQTTWDNRSGSLTSLRHWNIEGKIAVQNQAKKDSGSASLKWQQNNLNYTMLFYGPMGAGSEKLSGTPGKVVLEMSNGKTATAKSPEALLASQTGWRLPVSSMYYWVRGLPVPNLPVEKKFDSFNHVTQLNQQGWIIQYLRYTSVNKMDLPTKILLSNPQMTVKIIISHWNI
jgi:outer membrane lipoprotein LolB